MKRLLAVLLFLLILSALPVYLLGTEKGSRQLIAYLADAAGLDVAAPSGTLFSGLAIERLQWAHDGRAVVATQVSLVPRWRMQCLLRSLLCLRSASARDLTVTLPPADPDAASGFELPQRVELPAGLVVESLQLASLGLVQDGAREELRGLAARLRLDADGLQLQDFALEHNEVAVTGRLALGLGGDWPLRVRAGAELAAPPAELPAGWTLSLEGGLRDVRLQARSPAIEGLQLSGSLRANVDFTRLDLSLEAAGAELLPPLAALYPWLQPRAPLALQARLEGDLLRFDLHSRIAGYATDDLDLDLRVTADGGRWALVGLTLNDQSGAERLALRGPLGGPGNWAPTLNIQVRDLALPPETDIAVTGVSALAELRLGLQAGGAVEWRLTRLTGSARYDDMPVSVSGQLAGAADHALLPVGELRGSAREIPFFYSRPTAPGPVAVRLPEGLSTQGFALSVLDVEVNPGARTDVALTLEGDLSTALLLAVEETDRGADWRLQPFSGQLYGEALLSEEVLEGSWLRDSAELALQPFCLRVRAVDVCSDATQLGASGGVDLRLAGSEEWRGSLADNPYSVQVAGEGTLGVRWSQSRLELAELALRLPALGIDPFIGAGTAAPTRFEDVTIDGRATPELQTLVVRGGSAQLGQLSADLRRDGEELSGQVRLADMSLPAFDDLLPEVDITAGMLSGTLYVAGSLAEPELSGALELRDGAGLVPGQAMGLSNAQLYIGGRMDAFEVRGEALLGGGPLSIDGSCCADDLLRLTLEGERNTVRLPMGLDATISSTLAATVDADSASINGTVQVHRGLLQHSDPFGDGVALSDDVVRVDVPVAAPRRFAVGADIRAIIDPGFTLRSRQLEATLAGDLRLLAATGDPPQLFGDLRVLGGVLRAYGQGLRLDRGSIGFVGDPLNPDLDLRAVRDIRTEQLRVGVRAAGTLEAPQLTLFSDPQRSERETLSYLLRGRAPDAGAGADGTAMALSLGASAVNQSGLLDRLNSVPGLSEVSLGAEGSDDETAATISAYVGERLYLSYGMGIYEPVNTLTARLYLRSRLWLEVVSRLESSFDLYYRFDRD